jgi:hypothetical protein
MTVPTRQQSGGGRRPWWWVAGVVVLLMVGVAALVWLLAGRDDATVAGVQPTPTAEQTPSPSPKAEPTPTPATTPTQTAPSPTPEEESRPASPGLAGATHGPFSGSPEDPGLGGSWIADVRSAAHPGHDRVVIQFDGDYVPTYQVAYTLTSGPFHDVPGKVVPIEGDAFLDVWLQGTSAVDMSNNYTPVYTGPDRVRSDTMVVTEVVEIEDFEANVHWLIGLDTQAPFLVWTTDSPSRLVIDIES